MSGTHIETQRKLIATLDRIGFFQGTSVFAQDILNSDTQTEAFIKKHLSYTEHRLKLFEWLLQTFDDSLFKAYPIPLSTTDKDERIKRVRDVLMNLGLLYTNRYTKNIDFAKAIEGIAGAEIGFKLIYDLAKMVDKSRAVLEKAQITSPVETLGQVSQSKTELVNRTPLLFPLDFPTRYNLNAQTMQKELKTLNKQFDEQLQQSDTFADEELLEDEEQEDKFADSRLKAAYKTSLEEFTHDFKEFYHYNRVKTLKMKNLSLKYERNKIEFPAELPEHIEFLKKKAERVAEIRQIQT